MPIAPMRYYKPKDRKSRMNGEKYSTPAIAAAFTGIAGILVLFFLFLCSCSGNNELRNLNDSLVIENSIMKLRNESLTVDNAILRIERNVMKDEINILAKGMKLILDMSSKRVKVTGYHPDSGGINSDSNPSVTATMTPHKAGYTCAISTALVEAGWLGKEIYIDGFGMVLANDRLAPGIKGFQIDLCKGSYKDAMVVGENLNVLASLVSRSAIKQKLEEN